MRVVRPGERFVFSCLPLELQVARHIVPDSAASSLPQSWRRVRNAATSRDFIERIASLAGWSVVAWYSGDEPAAVVPGLGESAALGQSICVLERLQST
jgi:hypothetical protein